ncbi:unnamed protein product [Meloidogyne enterolobii]|uniref:Uncharacterized protein n=1 Tax=Meloidogyne enterolobii TaxID=390850 RepID=A0ACB0Y9L6_MELEN
MFLYSIFRVGLKKVFVLLAIITKKNYWKAIMMMKIERRGKRERGGFQTSEIRVFCIFFLYFSENGHARNFWVCKEMSAI